MDSPERIAREFVPAAHEIGDQFRPIRRPICRITDAVELHLDVRHSHFLEVAVSELDDLDVGTWCGLADVLNVGLQELAGATFLGTLVAEHGSPGASLERTDDSARLNERTYDRGGRFRPEGDRPSPFVRERVHLLLNDFGVFADAAREELRRFEEWRENMPISEAFCKIEEDALRLHPDSGVGRQDVVCAFRCAVGHDPPVIGRTARVVILGVQGSRPSQ